ncbi:CHAT domain-containing protein [Dactylosporangium sp. NBC_01737]|uniref:CHAT domain-containing protein n=1 Tax=Dactylosporangium sp. NBC_01737 TaxID=2975959 RepID=UPI002E134D6B|nr:CHAT domain-containing protein [Dactylosporangium sp. NBC_01737]
MQGVPDDEAGPGRAAEVARLAGGPAAVTDEEARDRAGGPVPERRTPVHRPASDARRAALSGLRGHAWDVLLQPDAAAAGIPGGEAGALDIARSCLAAGDPAAAVQALDAGCGLALHAATGFLDVATRLERADRQGLATRWRMAVGGARDVPAALRADVRAALSEGGGDLVPAGLLDPPGLPDIRSALTTLDADALVYLMPGAGRDAGWAVAVPAAGPPGLMALPDLLLDADADVERLITAAPTGDSAPGTVRGGLDGLCDWAWRAVVGPLVERFLPTLPPPPAGRPPRVVLVPMGDLARVPWQAARRGDGTYAVQLVAFSQAVSARMLCRSAAAPPVPVLPVGLIVADPQTSGQAGDLVAARAAAEAVHRAFYPGARYVGRRAGGTPSASGSGTAAEVREWLTTSRPGAGAMLHLACHGALQPAADGTTSHLLLAGPDGRLTAGELVALLAKAPERAIGLVVLAACRTGGSGRGHDPAFSLGAAFLAGGVRSVLSAQCGVPGQDASVLLYLFHHYLMTERRPAWDALRRAQLWMIDPDRAVPADMPAGLVRQLSGTDPARVVAWSGFIHSGQ